MTDFKGTITPHVVNAYVNLEGNPSWYFRRLGWIAEKEPVVWDWLSKLRQEDLKRIAIMCQSQFGSPFGVSPTLGPLIDQLLVRNFLRGFLMGCKYFAGEMNVPFMFTFPGQPIHSEKEGEDDFSEEQAVGPEDLEE